MFPVPKGFFALAVCVVGLLLSESPQASPAEAAPKPERERSDNPMPAPPGGELRFQLINDHLEVVTGERDEVEILLVGEPPANGRVPEIRLRQEGARIRAEVSPHGGSLHLRAVVPRRFNLDLRTSSGSITVSNIEGSVRIRTASGAINIADVRGDVDADGSGSSLAVRSATGKVRLRSAGGSLALGEAGGEASLATSGGSIKALITRGALRAKTTGGSIKVGAAFGAVRAETSGGSVTANFFAQPAGESSLRTEGGSVEARIADRLAFDVTCWNPAARIATDQPVVWTDAGGRATQREGKLRGGGPKLALRSSGAGVWLEGLGDTKLPDVAREFQFFPPGAHHELKTAARKVERPVVRVVERPVVRLVPLNPKERRVVVKDEFVVTPDGPPPLAAGLILPDGTRIAAAILSADDTQVVFQRDGAQPESMLLSRVAVVLFRPVPETKLGALRHATPGLLLRSGDFLDADLRAVEKGEVTMSSVLFGVRRVNVEKSAVALLLRAFRDPAP